MTPTHTYKNQSVELIGPGRTDRTDEPVAIYRDNYGELRVAGLVEFNLKAVKLEKES